ncbi:DUF5658 family protein [Candidatus Binatia bacterium]|nr:DUF5658 family protein [Candidatus Binatia bacterium]
MSFAERPLIHRLFVLNIALQAFDLVATYQGLQLGWREANPIIVAAFDYVGVGPALLLFKAKACGFLVLLRYLGDDTVVTTAMHLTAGAYATLSLVPWLAKYVGLLLGAI